MHVCLLSQEDDGHEELKGGSVDALIVYATLAERDSKLAYIYTEELNISLGECMIAYTERDNKVALMCC